MSLLDRHIEKREAELAEAKAIPEPSHGRNYIKWHNNVSKKQDRLIALLVLKAGIDPDSEDWK